MKKCLGIACFSKNICMFCSYLKHGADGNAILENVKIFQVQYEYLLLVTGVEKYFFKGDSSEKIDYSL